MTNGWQCLVIGHAYNHEDDCESGKKRVRSISARRVPLLPLLSGHQLLGTSLISGINNSFWKAHYVNVSQNPW